LPRLSTCAFRGRALMVGVKRAMTR
jgi:hypothetical protein